MKGEAVKEKDVAQLVSEKVKGYFDQGFN